MSKSSIGLVFSPNLRVKHTANLLTVVQTCRRQGRSVIDFFEQAIKAMVNPHMQEPSLIPQI